MTDYGKLRHALERLEAQLGNHQRASERHELTSLDREAIAESTIQRFKTAYVMAWKTLKRHLAAELGLPDVPNSPKPIFREAARNHLLEGRIAEWLRYADARTATAHDYDHDKALATLALIPSFVSDAIRLYTVMTGEALN
jgi:nucleotidyltransferase substrate binding protein (TIGR01987 family)